MEELGNNKQVFLNQIKDYDIKVATGEISKNELLKQLKELLNFYSDLEFSDYNGYVSEPIMRELEESLRDPNELSLWNRIETAPTSTNDEIQQALHLIDEYEKTYHNGPKIREAKKIREKLIKLLNGQKEASGWEALDKTNYYSMLDYKRKYPESVHLDELDHLMWKVTQKDMSILNIKRYIDDWKPYGAHVDEANKSLAQFSDWEPLANSDDIIKVAEFMKKNPTMPFINDVVAKLERLRLKEIDKIKSNPSKYDDDKIKQYLNLGIFTVEQMKKEGLTTDRMWEDLKTRSTKLSNMPDLSRHMSKSDTEANAGCTDVFLFGTPGTGKTCLLMGLAGAEGNGYSINFKTKGGPYASDLQQYVMNGITPRRTEGSYVTTINGVVDEKNEKGVYYNHRINIVEMSGEEFTWRIADNEEVDLEHMGTGTTKLLANKNRKVFFIIVDPTTDIIKFEREVPDYDKDGNRIGVHKESKNISQNVCLGKFVQLFEMEKNKELMKRVDAIHFIVTKSDTLGTNEEQRKLKARDILLEKYQGVVKKLNDFCRRTKRINFSTDYNPRVYPFSLGKFYIGDLFEFDKTETLKIVDTLRHITVAYKEPNFYDKLRDFLA